MPTMDQVIYELRPLFRSFEDIHLKLQELKNRPPSILGDDDNTEEEKLNDDVTFYMSKMRRLLDLLDRYPERHHSKHLQALSKFHKDGKWDESVFIMTKYPDNDGSPESVRLEEVIGHVAGWIKNQGFVPRQARYETAYPGLYENVELCMLGCARGVAIVESKYKPEFNPNVALEWGWMTGMGRPVIYLRENTFKHDRADWSGLIREPFDWDDPEAGIKAALSKHLKKA